MRREERIERARSLEAVIKLLSKNQLARFCAIVAGYQIHYKMSYYLAERSVRRLFMDLMFNQVMKKGKIEDRRNVVIEHLNNYAKPTMVNELIKLGKGCARNLSMVELNEMAKQARDNEHLGS